ncbi:MAG: c-type cytochrome, partial [Armatimonadota bacterium]|nr:c-type cytochrome [Armatimonadota bacterium]
HPLYHRLRAGCLATAIIGPLALVNVLAAADPPAGGDVAKQPTAAEKFKNIKVLRDLPADQLMTIMSKFNAGLGVKCGFCHVMGANGANFESDDKPEKGAARKMIVMSQDINAHQKAVGGKVTCYMCHHGHASPERDAPAPAQ